MSKPGMKGFTNPSHHQAGIKNYKNNNKKVSNKSLCCPFACPTCQSLGGELVKSKYEIMNILSDNSDSIFSPMHEQYHDDDDHKSIIRNDSAKVFLSADLVDSFFQKGFKKQEEV
jgi:hypothetical protein